MEPIKQTKEMPNSLRELMDSRAPAAIVADWFDDHGMAAFASWVRAGTLDHQNGAVTMRIREMRPYESTTPHDYRHEWNQFVSESRDAGGKT